MLRPFPRQALFFDHPQVVFVGIEPAQYRRDDNRTNEAPPEPWRVIRFSERVDEKGEDESLLPEGEGREGGSDRESTVGTLTLALSRKRERGFVSLAAATLGENRMTLLEGD